MDFYIYLYVIMPIGKAMTSTKYEREIRFLGKEANHLAS